MSLAIQAAIWLGAGITLVDPVIAPAQTSRRPLRNSVSHQPSAVSLTGPRRHGFSRALRAGGWQFTVMTHRSSCPEAECATAAGPTGAALRGPSPRPTPCWPCCRGRTGAGGSAASAGFWPTSVRMAGGRLAPESKRVAGPRRWWRSSPRSVWARPRTAARSSGCWEPTGEESTLVYTGCASFCWALRRRPTRHLPDGPGRRKRRPG